jgi:hypothetical protein
MMADEYDGGMGGMDDQESEYPQARGLVGRGV